MPHDTHFDVIIIGTGAGGGTLAYRLAPSGKEDFGEVRHWGGLSPAWPIAYEELEPYYTEADMNTHPISVPGRMKDRARHCTAGFALWLLLAIGVPDTERSLAFYRDVLGLRVAGESENYGTEQEHLNNVFGARLRITGLRAPGGPGIEFLEYLAPSTGRPTPVDIQANDLFHWQTTLAVPDLEAVTGRLRGGAYAFVSPGAVALPDESLGFARGMLVRDPDGHAMLLVEGQTSKAAGTPGASPINGRLQP